MAVNLAAQHKPRFNRGLISLGSKNAASTSTSGAGDWDGAVFSPQGGGDCLEGFARRHGARHRDDAGGERGLGHCRIGVWRDSEDAARLGGSFRIAFCRTMPAPIAARAPKSFAMSSMLRTGLARPARLQWRAHRFAEAPDIRAGSERLSAEASVQHRSAGNHDGRQIDAGRAHELAQGRLIASAEQDDAVDGVYFCVSVTKRLRNRIGRPSSPSSSMPSPFIQLR